MYTSESSDLVFTVYSCGIITSHQISITITLSSAGVVTGAVKIYGDTDPVVGDTTFRNSLRTIRHNVEKRCTNFGRIV